MIFSKLNELSHDISLLKGEVGNLKRENVILKRNDVVFRREISRLKRSDIWRHVGEHDDRFDGIDDGLEAIKARLEQLTGR
jgi:hypothetical protein